ncbi:ubiquinol-cytochrome C chaperone family protein [Sphingobium algorifonticola]|uniref:Ubiquinol-cytochrome C chaperone n=1 Tax=Sphingobium algorifonticola TaxID=2008318 RepID=A0A437J3H6_9SPHN|nr:ubiquinol-cytochrome C chaperone family protein [Sphingobium algorifonticola]RVT38891.1 ubiquinol-cytochrome C chaperone [Sphingobium algorifonticola]
MSLLDRLFPSLRTQADPRAALRPLYAAIVARGRAPHWYAQGAVPDTLDGRFDMIAAILCAVLLRLEGEDAARQGSVWLTEIFIEDMDGQLRQIGIGDMIVGKHIGKMMSALGGRLTAYRAGLTPEGDLNGALVRNLYRGDAPDAAALDHVAKALRDLWTALGDTPTPALLAGALPR